MSALLNIIYREYFRARLAEMRQPMLQLPPANPPSDDGAAASNARLSQ
jgi:hypothetical protein